MEKQNLGYAIHARHRKIVIQLMCNRNLHRASFRRFSAIAILTFGIFCSICPAQEPSDSVDTFDFDPELGLEFRFDDNIFKSATDVLSSWMTILSPGLSITARPTKHRFTFDYDGDFGWYSESSADNYDDHFFKMGTYLELGTRNNFNLEASYADAHQNRGTGLTEGFVPSSNVPAEPDEYTAEQLLSRFSFGSTESRDRLVLEAGYDGLEYTNHQNRTRFFNRSNRYGGAAIYLRVMPNTSLVLDARLTKIDYEYSLPEQPSRNNNEHRYMAGLTWETTATTRGTLKFGYFGKDFAEAARADLCEPSWEVDIRWSPRSYSHFDIKTARYPTETNGGGDYVRNTDYSFAWEHDWTKRLASRLAVRDLDQEYRGAIISRNQELTQYMFFLAFQMRRWLELKTGVVVSSRDSTIDELIFDGNFYSVSALVTL